MVTRSRTNETLIFLLVVLGVAIGLVGIRLSAYGIWDPWELNVADAARRTLENPGARAVELDDPPSPLTIESVALGFRTFGIREWAGRLPMALWGIAAVLLAFVLVERLYDRRAALYAGMAAATTPLFLLSSRQMLGETPAMAATGLVLLGTLGAVWVPGSEERTRTRDRILWSLAAIAGLAVGLFGGGALLSIVPPLVASGVGSVVGLRLARVAPPPGEARTEGPPYREQRKPAPPPTVDREQTTRSLVAALVVGLGAAVTIAVLVAVAISEADYSLLTGGIPTGGNPPTWDKVIEQVAHAFVPWVAVLPLAVGRTFTAPPGTAEPEAFGRAAALRLTLGLTAAIGYAAHTAYASRYGESGFVPMVALAALAGVTLRDFEVEQRPWRTGALVALLALAVVIRDYSLYPKSPLDGLGVAGLTVPETFNPKRAWQVLLAIFAITLYFPLAQGAVTGRADDLFAELFRFERWIARKWRTSMIARAVFLFVGTVLLVLFVLGLGSALSLHEKDVFPWSRTTSLLRRVLMAVGLGAAIAIRLAFLSYVLLERAFAMLKSFKLVPALVAAVVVAGYTSHVFVPKLSEHFSPREVYDTFNRLARAGEPLGEYRVGGRAAVYYARGQVRELREVNDFVEFLRSDARRFVSFPADQLAELNRAYRARTQRHLFVVDARSARVLLASNSPIPGERNQNVLARFVRSRGPTPQHRVGAMFDGKIELVGYDLETPQPGYVGAGQEVTFTWHWRVVRPVPGGYQLFVHIDGHGQRLNGDHIPVDSAYPINLWAAGDYILDRQTLKVPTNYSSGSYTIFIGIFSGETRLRLEDGPHDGGENRARVGELVVR
ncbi:MAG: glycosyltransferase family 39 protein [Deltaproteobacteria bacterium]|nr:glycosyltransferase family 39 protein [Deltaproteobacteria bacterium]